MKFVQLLLMKFVQLLLRVALLSLAAAVFAGLTRLYGGSERPRLPNPGWQAERRHRPSQPHFGEFQEFVGEGGLLIFFAISGRIVLRLRLSPVSRSEGRPILLGLHQQARIAKSW